MLHSFPSLIAHSYRPGASTTVPLGEGVGGLKRCSTLGDKRQTGVVTGETKARRMKQQGRREQGLTGRRLVL